MACSSICWSMDAVETEVLFIVLLDGLNVMKNRVSSSKQSSLGALLVIAQESA